MKKLVLLPLFLVLVIPVHAENILTVTASEFPALIKQSEFWFCALALFSMFISIMVLPEIIVSLSRKISEKETFNPKKR